MKVLASHAWRSLRCASLVFAAGVPLVSAAPASAAVGVLDASVVECTTIDGQSQGIVGVAVTDASPNTTVYVRMYDDGIQAGDPPLVSVGATDSNGSLTARLAPVSDDIFPVGIGAYTSDSPKVGPEQQIGAVVRVEFVCPVLTPQNAIDQAVDAGVLTEREATPVAVKFGAAAAQEAKGNVQAAINLLEAGRYQLNALVASGRLTQGEAQPLLNATNQEIQRLGGTP
jgi:hypothetical protein